MISYEFPHYKVIVSILGETFSFNDYTVQNYKLMGTYKLLNTCKTILRNNKEITGYILYNVTRQTEEPYIIYKVTKYDSNLIQFEVYNKHRMCLFEIDEYTICKKIHNYIQPSEDEIIVIDKITHHDVVINANEFNWYASPYPDVDGIDYNPRQEIWKCDLYGIDVLHNSYVNKNIVPHLDKIKISDDITAPFIFNVSVYKKDDIKLYKWVEGKKPVFQNYNRTNIMKDKSDYLIDTDDKNFDVVIINNKVVKEVVLGMVV